MSSADVGKYLEVVDGATTYLAEILDVTAPAGRAKFALLLSYPALKKRPASRDVVHVAPDDELDLIS